MNDEKKKQIVKWLIGLGAIGAGGVVAGFLLTSLIQLVAFGAILFCTVQFAPLFAQAVGQAKMKGLKFMSAKNPVEDLQLLYLKKSEQVKEAGKKITELATATKNYKSKLDDFKARRPNKADEFQKTYDNMAKVVQIQTAKVNAAQGELRNFEAVIIEAQDIWNMTQEAIKANAHLKNFEQPDPIDEIRQRTALDSVTSSLNQVMAELETSLALDYNSLNQTQTAALENNASPTLQSTNNFATVKEVVAK